LGTIGFRGRSIRNPPGNVGLHCGWLGKGLLSCRFEAGRLSDLLLYAIRYSGSGQHVLPHAAISTVKGWYAKTPPGFLFAAKVPQVITHEKVLRDCETDLSQFLKTMDCLGEKLGPLLFQFGYFNKKAFLGVNDFLARLGPYLKKLPKGYRFALEIRNKKWLVPQFVESLRERNVALALVDHVWMPRPRQLFDRFDPITTDFTYVRWIGDRKGIEEQTKVWDKIIVDRSADLAECVELLKTVHKRKIQILAFANNHYAGYGPGTIEQFRERWRRVVGGKPESTKSNERAHENRMLFD
jgi:uncharacterized protein YecE (DUF72 family)